MVPTRKDARPSCASICAKAPSRTRSSFPAKLRKANFITESARTTRRRSCLRPSLMQPSRKRKRNCSRNGSRRERSTTSTGPSLRPLPPILPQRDRSGCATKSIPSSSPTSRSMISSLLLRPMVTAWCVAFTSTWSACPPPPNKPTPSSATYDRTLTNGWSKSYSSPRIMGRNGRANGSTLPAMRIAMDTRRIAPATSGPTATGSSGLSTRTCPTTNSPSSNLPATCCPTPPKNRKPPPDFTAIPSSTRKAGSTLSNSASMRRSTGLPPPGRSGWD